MEKEMEIALAKADILMKENMNIRGEMIMVEKNIHNCFFAIFTFTGVSIGLFINLNSQETDSSMLGLLVFVISQIEIALVIYSYMLSSDMFTKAAYMWYLEEEINKRVGVDTIFWESRGTDYNWHGAMRFNAFLMFFLYLGAFIAATVYCAFQYDYPWNLWVQIPEAATVIIFGMVVLPNIKKNVYNKIRKFRNEPQI
ncbi:MAG TPA: hypothetical protein VK808_00015 [Bacteroidia bacterium]|jgi:hypothetical protein|nr:hypothetical protein [Bacteroidia bacterium]